MVRGPKLSPPKGQVWTQLSSVAAVVSAALGIPSAVVATYQAKEAKNQADAITVKSAELERLAAANEAQLTEMRRLAAATEMHGTQTARAADSASSSARELSAIAAATRSNASTAREMADAAKRQLQSNDRRLAEDYRPKIVVTNGAGNITVGEKPKFRVSYENTNPAAPAPAWIVTEFRRVTGAESWGAAACKPDGQPSMVIAKPLWTDITATGVKVTEKELSDLTSGKVFYAFSGSICYPHAGKIYRTRFCYLVRGRESELCSTGNGLD